MSNQEQELKIIGLVSDVSFQVARNCAEDLAKLPIAPDFSVVVQPLLEFEWRQFVNEAKRQFKGDFWAFDEQVLVFLDNQPRGSAKWLLQWAMEQYSYEDFRPLPLYTTLTEDAYVEEFQRRQHDFVYLEVTIGNSAEVEQQLEEEQLEERQEFSGRLVLELFTDVAPRTCRNFKQLCTGEAGVSKHNPVEQFNLCYKNSIFHRLVPNGWIQGGDIWYGRGTGGESIYGQTFEDENFKLSHNERGVLSMANRGRHTNGSQFFLTLKPSTWMDTKFVAFGRLVEGYDILERMESVATVNERPLDEIRISDCGVYEPKLSMS